jgi:tRNA pseudouridine13 synthase
MEDSQQNLEDNMKALKSNGFINYFGMQRFGTTSIGTHEIGRKILAGRFEDAVNAILCSRKDGSHFISLV